MQFECTLLSLPIFYPTSKDLTSVKDVIFYFKSKYILNLKYENEYFEIKIFKSFYN